MQSVSAPSSALPINAFSKLTGAAGLTTQAADPSGQDPAVKEFMDYVNLTPAQKMRASILSGMGMKEEDLARMSPDERKKVEDKIKEAIKAEIEKGDKDHKDHKGMLVDVTA